MMLADLLPRACLLLVLPTLGVAQSLVVDGQVIPANERSVAPAFEVVDPASTNATAPLFDGETRQFTDAVLKNLTDLQLTNIVLFAFPDVFAKADVKLGSAINSTCKTFSDDFVGFPGSITSRVFNLLLGGGLIRTTPFASPCFSDFGNQDADKCAHISANWHNDSYMHTDDPTSVNAVLFQGMSCMPPSINPGQTTCTLGGYPKLSIRATTVAQVQLAINLARNLNLRLVIKNTGHDFAAKSTGAGGVSIWTHNMKDINFYENYEEGPYRGPAFKLGAGVQVYEAYEAAHKEGVTIVGGEGRVLSMEVVTADGHFVTASETSNPDLFWALRGGGGSTYGVVTSMVVKAFPKMPVTTLTFSFSTSQNVTVDQFWGGVRTYFGGFINYTDAGTYGYFSLRGMGGNFRFAMKPWFAPNMSRSALEALAAPLLDDLAGRLSIPIEPVFAEYDSFYEAWDASFPLEGWGSGQSRPGSRLFPRSSWEDDTALSNTFEAVRYVVDQGGAVIGFHIAASPVSGYPDNAVNPAWREAVFHGIDLVSWDQDASPEEIETRSRRLTDDWGQRWRDVSPGSGAYLSESDYIEPDFQHSFWGDKYERLYELKKKFDPYDLFYAHQTVGSENWETSELLYGHLPSQNSRLCRKGTASK
ncbi:hypothetical protein DL767_006038 [Monosporascus sp. MG133]|nr:hypothetical protein DL767_006038 [Monosporascus sp. MG133]